MGIGDTGISPSYKRPTFIGKLVYAGGAVGAGSQRLACLCVGMKTAAGSMVADQDIVRVTNEDEVDSYAGVGSQLARMAYKALKVPGAEVFIAAVTEPSGDAATATLVLSGTLTTGGTLRFRIAGVTVTVSVSVTDDIDTIGAAIAAAFNAKTRLPVTAAYSSGTDTVTITCRNKGTQGKDWILYWDTSNGAETVAGLAIAMTGSAAVNTQGVRLGASSTGTGSEDATTLLTKLVTKRYARIAVGHNDAVNAALWETQVNTLGGPLAMLYEQFVLGHNGTKAAAQTLAQTTMNAFLGELVWIRNCESHPAEIAAYFAAIRSVTEQTKPVPDYDNLPLSEIAPQVFDTDIPTEVEQDQVLNTGVTPGYTVNGEARIARAITTYCLNGSDPDERCLDIGDAVFPQYAMLDLKAMYETEFRPANPLVGPNPAPEEESPLEGVGYPDLWNSLVANRAEEWYASTWTEERPVGVWAPRSDFVKAGRYIVDELPLPVRRVQHRLDQVVRQVFNQT